MKNEENNIDNFDLIITNGYSEKKFIKLYGQDLFDELKNNSLKKSGYRCQSCGHMPPENRIKDCLFYHINEVNNDEPSSTKGVTLCKMCHMTQHIEAAIKKKWVIFVNSIYSQNNIIRLTRASQIHQNIDSRAIVILKTTPESFLKKLYDGQLKITNTLKVIFNNNFNIDDLY